MRIVDDQILLRELDEETQGYDHVLSCTIMYSRVWLSCVQWYALWKLELNNRIGHHVTKFFCGCIAHDAEVTLAAWACRGRDSVIQKRVY